MLALKGMLKGTFWLILVSSVAIAGYAFVAYAFLTPGQTVHPKMKAAYAVHPARILVHVAASLITLAVGPWQFIPALRRRKTLHRVLGFVYFVAVVIGGVAGLFTAFIAQGGTVGQVGFAVLAVLWVATAIFALISIKRRNYLAHEAWVIRSFALAFSAVTLRMQLGLSFAGGARYEDFYPILSWTCWIPNLLVAEWLIRRRPAAQALAGSTTVEEGEEPLAVGPQGDVKPSDRGADLADSVDLEARKPVL
jgi:hypothetical protein